MSTAGPRPETALLPRLLSGTLVRGSAGLARHLEVHGSMPSIPTGRRGGAQEARAALIEEVSLAGLRGRGGGAFSTARKLRAVAEARGKPIVVVNGAEREPASLKDVTLLGCAPHLVLDGGALAAKAVGAEELIICVCEWSSDAMQSVSRAVEERKGLAGDPAKVSVVGVPAPTWQDTSWRSSPT